MSPLRIAAIVVACSLPAARQAGAEARVELNVLTEEGLSPGGVQEWYQILVGLGLADVQFRGATAGQEIDIKTRGTAASPTYQVTGILTARNELVVPGGKFTARDRQRLSAWLKRLEQFGPEVVSSGDKAPFDLAPALLTQARRAVRRPLATPTRGEDFAGVYERLERLLAVPIVATAEAQARLRDASVVDDELQGLACGTALAALLRPLGLALAPHRARTGELEFLVFRPGETSEIWPIGWPAEEQRRQLVPKLFEFLNIEVDNVSVAAAVETMRARLSVPLLYDHNALARHGLDPAEAPAKLPAKRTSYSLALQKVLFQARLKLELRTDDAGKPFFWVTSLKPL